MRIPVAARLRSHWQILVIAPLVIIVMTWPTFARLFDGDEFWLHTPQVDKWFKFWDAWYLGRVLSGQSDYYFTDLIFHPVGTSLAFHQISLPHALLFLALQKFIPADDAYNLLFLLILCFNAFCAYALIHLLIGEKWIALFGAVVFTVSTPFPYLSTLPDLIMIGTLPLTMYYIHRSIMESRSRFAALAGFCAGLTAFIGMYIFVIILISVGIYAAFHAHKHGKTRAFWRGLLIFFAACSLFALPRLYPMVADATVFQRLSLERADRRDSNDLLEHFALPLNPISGAVFRKLFDVPPDPRNHDAYLGYINLALIAFALIYRPGRRRLLPWLVMMAAFALLRLGHYMTLNGREYPDILLPQSYLSDLFPALFGAFSNVNYYQIGVVAPLAVLSSFGLARLLKSRQGGRRIAAVLILVCIVTLEFYFPRQGQTLEQDKTAFVDWLRSDAENRIKLIHLPQTTLINYHYVYFQTLAEYPQAYGLANNIPPNALTYVRSNALLRNWDKNRSVHCLPHNERSFTAALQQLLADGFTHVVLHNWLYGDQFVMHSFWNVPTAYDDGAVSIYRLRDMQNSCQEPTTALPRFNHFAASPAALPGPGSSILSLHPSERIDDDLFAYLESLFSDWRRLTHIYQDEGKLAQQGGGQRYTDPDAITKDNQVLYVLYNKHDTDPGALIGLDALDEFALCLSRERDDGSVIEQYVSREFSCALVTAPEPLQVAYDNGAKLENALVGMTNDQLDVQLMWSSVPSETHSTSLQIFDAAGSKVSSQDAVLDSVSLARHRIDVSTLAPGAYLVKIILYNFNTGVSVAGTMIANGAPFDRELEIGSFNKP